MKSIKIDDVEILQFSANDQKVWEADLLDAPADLNRRLIYKPTHECELCLNKLKSEYTIEKLEALGVATIPTKRDDFVNLVTALPSYKDANGNATGSFTPKVLKVDATPILTISEVDIKLLKHCHKDSDAKINEMLIWIVGEKTKGCQKRLVKKWVDDGKLEKLGVTDIPTDKDALTAVIFARPEYKNRATLVAESEI